jgi:hypothetical protein
MSTFDGNIVVLTGYLADVSTASQVYIPIPDDAAGEVFEIRTALNNAITSDDAVITPKIGGTAMTNGAITITQSGSAAGDVDVSRPTGARTVAAGDSIEIETDGGSSTTAILSFSISIKR